MKNIKEKNVYYKYVYILEDLTQFTSHFYPHDSIDSKHLPKYIQDNF